MIIGLPIVVFLKCLRSAGMCQINVLSRPITRFCAMAAMDERYIFAIVPFSAMVSVMIMKEPPESYICIYVREISVDVCIGIYEWEAAPQRLLVSVALYTGPDYLKDVSENSIIDYKKIYDAVLEWPKRPHVRLIETYVQELLALAFGFEKIEAARVSVTKADIFPQAQGAGVEVFMRRGDYRR